MYWLSTLYMIGSRKQNLLLKYFGSAKEAFYAPADTLRDIFGLTENNIRSIKKNREKISLENDFKLLKQMDISFTHLGHSDYPKLLALIPDAPVGLFYIGELPGNSLPTIAIIGSRRCSEYGLSTARKFGASLARQGVVVVSGMARGIDSMAHKGALDSGGLTVAVLGCGVDICYPADNRTLRDKIIRNGAVISEYPPGINPRPSYFPARNRIISGLSQVVLVVESGKKSGTLITVDQALEQGREVMAVPGNITNRYSEGTNNLIKQGAEPACNYEDILHMLGIVTPSMTKNNVITRSKSFKEIKPLIATEEKLVYDALDSSVPMTVEEIMIKTNSKPQTIQYVLTMLELKGYIKRLPGMRYLIN